MQLPFADASITVASDIKVMAMEKTLSSQDSTYRRRARRRPTVDSSEEKMLLTVVVVLLLTECVAASDGDGVAVTRPERELDMMCPCYPCGQPCSIPSPPPPPPPPPPACPPPPLPPSPPCYSCNQPPTPPCYSCYTPGNVYPVDPEYLLSGAWRTHHGWWTGMISCGLLAMLF